MNMRGLFFDRVSQPRIHCKAMIKISFKLRFNGNKHSNSRYIKILERYMIENHQDSLDLIDIKFYIILEYNIWDYNDYNNLVKML